MKTGVELILDVRTHQVIDLGFTPKSDSENNKYGELIAAARYLLTLDRNMFPYTWDLDWMKRLDKKTWKEKLAIAGAFIAAEIDRIQYNEENDKKESS